MTGSRKLVLTLGVAVAALAAMQLVPYGHDHARPPDGVQATWDSPATQKLAERACFDCHSNRTTWPWYAGIAPVSWLIQRDVNEGRARINFTAFDPAAKDVADAAGEAGKEVAKGDMPPPNYLLMHPTARLTPAEKRALAAGLERTFAAFLEDGEQGKGGTAVGDVDRPGAASAAAPGERGKQGENGEKGDHD